MDVEILELAELARAGDDARYCLVVVPSMTFDQELLQNVLGVEHYEERLLAMLLQLTAPNLQVVFCSSAPIAEEIVEYYLDLIPGVPVVHSRPRLTMVTCDDRSPRSLTEKLMERPARLREIREVLRSCVAGGIVCMNTTERERQLSDELGVPLLGNPRTSTTWAVSPAVARCSPKPGSIARPVSSGCGTWMRWPADSPF